MEENSAVRLSGAAHKEWYKTWWGFVISFIFLPPFLVYYAWLESKWSVIKKVGATVLAVIMVLAVMWLKNR